MSVTEASARGTFSLRDIAISAAMQACGITYVFPLLVSFQRNLTYLLRQIQALFHQLSTCFRNPVSSGVQLLNSIEFCFLRFTMPTQLTLGRTGCGLSSASRTPHPRIATTLSCSRVPFVSAGALHARHVHCSASSRRRFVRAATGPGDKATHGAPLPRPDDSESNADHLIGKAIQYDIERVDVPPSETRVSVASGAFWLVAVVHCICLTVCSNALVQCRIWHIFKCWGPLAYDLLSDVPFYTGRLGCHELSAFCLRLQIGAVVHWPLYASGMSFFLG